MFETLGSKIKTARKPGWRESKRRLKRRNGARDETADRRTEEGERRDGERGRERESMTVNERLRLKEKKNPGPQNALSLYTSISLPSLSLPLSL